MLIAAATGVSMVASPAGAGGNGNDPPRPSVDASQTGPSSFVVSAAEPSGGPASGGGGGDGGRVSTGGGTPAALMPCQLFVSGGLVAAPSTGCTPGPAPEPAPAPLV